ncbi:GGDEF domain-containing protein [Nodularia sphaerocarpa]|uniref:GGDEF domain-containing protein n=1 Tax=Nodularia sphaerocarpa TaxID=137816 RepID=UPI001EFBB275|nr:diguanylate cyclase [Nodularia sphaerocarpa]MDB9375446.1 diguanylate cyclase [Nodularia sphaerocarpa CS-585]MDB9379498.1 diguanylate cyclase [Nodularia sphaerocarpa CS-585A2]ULP71993.1 Response regulator PleD [Nodularia sphaerocarpa UHCC 0038]
MKISILVFGSNNFLATLPHNLLDVSDSSIEVIMDIDQAVSHIQIAPPDVIIAQASLVGSMELCRWLKTQTQISWIYCILLEDRPQHLAARNQQDWEWELEMTANALSQGADAYIWQVAEAKTDCNFTGTTAHHTLLLAQVMVGVRKAQKYRDLLHKNDLLSTIALADSLTEMNNRRALEWELPRQIIQARTEGNPLSLIILDVDYFKQVNDNYGHLVGDRLLQLLCHRLRHNLRSQDIPFRYGGEEFVVILSNTKSEEALLVAKRVNRIIGEEPFKINSKIAINITISLGVSCLQAEDDVQGFKLLNRADQYLFQAKAAGRNQAIGRDCSSSVSPLKAVSSEKC